MHITLYRLFNPDLLYYDNDDFLIEHYLEKGRKENRLYKMPEDFNSLLYNQLNPDIGKLSKSESIEHFKNIGIRENRIYKFPEDFDYDLYKLVYLNNDDKMDEEKIKSYYLEHGILKKHWTKLPEDFDIKIYKKLNQDLETLDKNEITKQFVKIGHKTRIYK